MLDSNTILDNSVILNNSTILNSTVILANSVILDASMRYYLSVIELTAYLLCGFNYFK